MTDDDREVPPAREGGTPVLERLVGALGAALLLGVSATLGWDALTGGREPPSFRFEVLGTAPSGDRHLLRFRVRNEGGAAVEKLAVEGRLAAEPAETAALTLDYLAAGEEREAALVFGADPSRHRVTLAATSFIEP